MTRLDVLSLIEHRRSYPVTTRRIDYELDYVSSILDPAKDRIALVVPSCFLLYRYGNLKPLRNLILSEWHISGIFDLSSIWKPYTTIPFTLLVLDKEEPRKVLFGIYNGGKTFRGETRNVRNGVIGPQTIEPEYEGYVDCVEKFLTSAHPPEYAQSKFFIINYCDLDLDRLHVNYYDPELTDIEDKIRKETFAPLGEIAQVLIPRRAKSTSERYAIRVKDFKYPLEYGELSQRNATNVILQKGDIVITPDLGKAYLVAEEPQVPLTPSLSLVVVRPDQSKISPEYLCLYFQSDVAKKYSLRYQTGSVIVRMRVEDLLQFPIILPALSTTQKARSIFKKLYLQPPSDIEDFYKEIFSPVDTGERIIQREFIIEGLEKLRVSKLALVNKLVREDLDELGQCLVNGLYKSCLILCGSVLEAVLLDWLSDVEGVNYYEKAKPPTLYKMINRLYSLTYLDEDSKKQAHRIRLRRNWVHPKEYLNSRAKLNRGLCIEILNGLKKVLEQRGL